MIKKSALINLLMASLLFTIILVIYLSLKSNEAQPDLSELNDLINVKNEPFVPNSFDEIVNAKLDIRYATKNNFTGEQIYPCGRCFLRNEVKEALAKAEKEFISKGYKLILFDCYRPAPAQKKLWSIVPNPDYVTPPEKGSMHNRGLAVDLSLTDLKGNILDMGTDYDYFGEEAHINYIKHPTEVLENRKLLTKTLEKYGFKGIRTEWWHFSYQNLSSPIENWEWECK